MINISRLGGVRISPAGEPATGDNVTRSVVLPASPQDVVFQKVKEIPPTLQTT